jgi:hypothetical protein
MSDGNGQGNNSSNDGGTPIALAAIIALIAPLTVAIGSLVVSGPVGRIQRNEPFLFTLALALLIIGSAIWFLVMLPKRPSLLQWVAVGIVCVGYIGAFAIAIYTANQQPRPRIAANLSEDRTKLTTTITASDLKTDDRLAIFIDGYGQIQSCKTGQSRSSSSTNACTGPLWDPTRTAT